MNQRKPESFYELTPREARELPQRVLAHLSGARGASSAITARTLSQALGERGDRKLRVVIAFLIGAGHPIASSVGAQPGYFMIADAKEARRYLATLRSRAVATMTRYRDFSRAAQKHFNIQIEQLPLL